MTLGRCMLVFALATQAAVAQTPPPSPAGDSAGAATETHRVGFWEITRSWDSFTDRMTCSARHATSEGVYLLKDALTLSMMGRGGVSGYEFRVDDHPPADRMRLPAPFERRMSSAVFQGKMLEDLKVANRLRARILPLLNMPLVHFDVPLAGLASAVTFLNGPDCK